MRNKKFIITENKGHNSDAGSADVLNNRAVIRRRIYAVARTQKQQQLQKENLDVPQSES